MNSTLKTFLFLATLCLAAAPGSAQTRVKIPPPEFVRETEADKNGLLQWTEFKVKCEPCQGKGKAVCQGCDGVDMPDCTECKGTKRTRCRQCLGTKYLLDPLTEMNCPPCYASGWYNCGQCNGFGGFTITSGSNDPVPTKCGACKRKGRYACVVCKGKGRIPTVRVKKKPAGGAKKLDDVKSVHEVLVEALAAYTDFEPDTKPSKSLKAMELLVKKYNRRLPELESMLEMTEIALKGLTKADQGFAGAEASKTHQILLLQDRSVFVLQFNVRLLDQCIARLEHNATVEEGK